MRFRVVSAFVLVGSMQSMGCGGARSSQRPVASAAPAEASIASMAPSSAPPTRQPGPLTRSEAIALVAQGLGPLMARIAVTPMFHDGRFVGFRLDAARDLDAWHAAGADIRTGDVILRVNGIRIERPEQALWAFERLRIAEAIEVQLLRDGSPVTVRSPIVEDAHARAQE